MRAVIFNKFPENLASKLRRHLVDDYGVEIQYFGPPKFEMQKPEGCDAVISFFEMMSHMEADVGSRLSKKWGVPSFLLSRKAATWVHQLPAPVGQKVAVNDAAPPAPKPAPLVIVRRPTNPPEPEKEAPAAAPPAVAGPGWSEAWEEVEALFSAEVEDLKMKLAAALAEAEAEKKRHAAEMQKATNLEHQTKALETSCLSLTESRKRLEKDVEKLESELELLDATLASVKTALEAERASKSVGLAPAFAAVQTLYEAGAMDEEAAGKMLVNLLLKKKT